MKAHIGGGNARAAAEKVIYCVLLPFFLRFVCLLSLSKGEVGGEAPPSSPPRYDRTFSLLLLLNGWGDKSC